MDIDLKQFAALEPIVVKYHKEIADGRPWAGESALTDDTLHAVATGAANTYMVGALVTELDRADDSQEFLLDLLATAFAHGFNTATTYAAPGQGDE